MSAHSLVLDADAISDNEFYSFSQNSSQSQFKTDNDADSNYEDDSQEIPTSDFSSSQEFSQVDLPWL